MADRALLHWVDAGVEGGIFPTIAGIGAARGFAVLDESSERQIFLFHDRENPHNSLMWGKGKRGQRGGVQMRNMPQPQFSAPRREDCYCINGLA